MSNPNNFPFPKQLKILNFFIFSFLIFSNIIIFSKCSTCAKDNSIYLKTCFNDVLLFNNKKYRAGHFVTYKNKDMIVEFSDDGGLGGANDGFSRIFYGLKSNGRYYFPNESPTWEINNIGKIDSARGRYESLNTIVYTEDDLNRESEILFSISSYDSLTELHFINNKTYTYTKTTNFVSRTLFSFQYNMVEVEHNNKIFYFIAFTHSSVSTRNGDNIDIKKFGFKSFSFNDVNTYSNKVVTIYDNHDDRIVHLFVLKNFQTLALIHDRKDNNNNYLTLKFYDYDLNSRGSDIDLGSISYKGKNSDGDGAFFKSVELPDNQRAFILYYDTNAEKLHIKIFKFSQNSDNSISKSEILSSYTTTGYWFSSYVTFNDVYKLSDTRLAVVTTSTAKDTLVLLMHDLYNNYKNLKRRWYYFNINGFNLNKELSLYSFNDFLMLTMTGGSDDHLYVNLMIFGFANGTDSVIDIAPYLSDSPNYNPNLHLIKELYSKVSIDNNIFGYVKVDQIKIVSTPEQIK